MIKPEKSLKIWKYGLNFSLKIRKFYNNRGFLAQTTGGFLKIFDDRWIIG